MIYNRSELGKGIGFTSITDSKFKTCSVSVYFLTELNAEKAALYSLAASALSVSSSKYPTFAALSEKLSELYGAGLSSFARKKGDSQSLCIKASWLDSKYALDGEDTGKEMAELIKDCIFSPNAENGAFDEESFKIVKKDLLDNINSDLNDKRSYALMQASKTAYRGEPSAVPSCGTKETALAATSEDAYDAYIELMRTAQIEIFLVSPEKNDSIPQMFKESFASVERAPKTVNVRNHSPLKLEAETVSEEYDVNQSKAVFVFKTDSDDRYALKMLSIIYGEMPFSKLFLTVREKLSLCYYCTTSSVSEKGAFFVDIGVERSNIEKAKAEILAQLEEIKHGNITDEEIDSTMMALDNAVLQIGDTPSSYIGWYFDCFCDSDLITPEEHFRRFREVTKERIIEAAKSLKLDTIYLMLSKEAEDK